MEVWVVFCGYDYGDGSRDDWYLDIYANEELAAETVNNWVEWQKGIHEEGTYTIEERSLDNGAKWVGITHDRDESCEWIRYQKKLVSDFASKFIPEPVNK